MFNIRIFNIDRTLGGIKFTYTHQEIHFIARSLYVFGSRISLLCVYYCYCFASQTSVWFFIIFVCRAHSNCCGTVRREATHNRIKRTREERKDYGFQYLLVFEFSLHWFSRVVAVIAASHGYYFNPDTFRIYFFVFPFFGFVTLYKSGRLHRKCRYIRVFESTYHPSV